MKYILPLLALSACAPVVTSGGTEPDTCGKDSHAALIGTPVSETPFANDAKTRIIAPDVAVTTDFQTDRLNVFVDETGLITRISCG